MRRSGPLVVVALAGVAAVVSTAAGWALRPVERNVGGVIVPETEPISGATLAPEVLVLALLTFVVAALLALLPGASRRLAAAIGVVLGVAIAVLAVWHGFWAQLSGAPTPAPIVTVVAGLAVAGGSLLAARSQPARVKPHRYDVDVQARSDDAEWRLAADDERQ